MALGVLIVQAVVKINLWPALKMLILVGTTFFSKKITVTHFCTLCLNNFSSDIFPLPSRKSIAQR